MLIIFLLCLCCCFRFELSQFDTQVSWFWQDQIQVPIILGCTVVILAGMLLVRWIIPMKNRT